MFVLEDGVSFPEEHDLTTVGALMLQYGWKCVLFGCYDFFGSPPNRYTVKPAFCTVGMSSFRLLYCGITGVLHNECALQMKMSVLLVLTIAVKELSV